MDADGISMEEFFGRLSAWTRAANEGREPVDQLAERLHIHLNAFAPARKALDEIVNQRIFRAAPVNATVPHVTALQILERIAIFIKEPAKGNLTGGDRLLILNELVHLANVAMGRASIDDWPKPKAT